MCWKGAVTEGEERSHTLVNYECCRVVEIHRLADGSAMMQARQQVVICVDVPLQWTLLKKKSSLVLRRTSMDHNHQGRRVN